MKQFRRSFGREQTQRAPGNPTHFFSHPRFEMGELIRPAKPGREIEVRHAVDRESGKPVVLKRLLPHASSRLANRFANECLMTPATPSPFVVRQVNIDAQALRTLLATEFIQGLNLHRELRSGKSLSFRRKLRILDTLCQALAEVHDQGVVHGDIAPSNILVRADGSCCLIDFGLAQQIREPRTAISAKDLKPSPKKSAHQLTATTHIAGTPGFLSPEAIRLEPLRFESDIYSWGCIAFYLLSEAMPFEGRTPIEVLWRQKHHPPPTLDPRTFGTPTATTQVHLLVRDCLQPNPEDRPPDMVTVRTRLT